MQEGPIHKRWMPKDEKKESAKAKGKKGGGGGKRKRDDAGLNFCVCISSFGPFLQQQFLLLLLRKKEDKPFDFFQGSLLLQENQFFATLFFLS